MHSIFGNIYQVYSRKPSVEVESPYCLKGCGGRPEFKIEAWPDENPDTAGLFCIFIGIVAGRCEALVVRKIRIKGRRK